MKVLFLNVLDDPEIGAGVEMTLHHLTQGLIQHGIEPVMLSITKESGLHQTSRNGIRIWRAGIRNIYQPDLKHRHHPAARALWHFLDSYNAAMQPLLRRVLTIEKPDVVSLHNLPGWSSAVWKTIAELDIPSVQVLHDAYNLCPKGSMYREGHGNCSAQCFSCRLLRLPHRTLSRRLSAVVGVSNFILERHVQAGYFTEVPVRRVINNARDPTDLGTKETKKRPPDSTFRVGFIGRLDPTKGIELLLHSFRAAGLDDAELWIAGTGESNYECRLKAQYSDANVRFLGRVSPRDFYPNVDVIVVPSLWHDTFPGVVFEALAFGKPVIGSRRGGIPEIIQNGQNGFLFEPNSPQELTDLIRTLAADNDLRNALNQAALESASRYLDRKAWVNSYLNIYKQVSKSTKRSSGASTAQQLK